MKNYTAQELREARAKAPQPISDFLNSETLISIYVGIFTKQKLNLRQGGLITEIVNATLAGLEPEHAIETNIHQALPELSNEGMRELLADINDRIFKEASRRLQQNILEPKPEWDETELGPEPTPQDIERNRAREDEEEKHPLSDDQLKKLAEQEEMQHKIQEDAEEAAAEKVRLAEPQSIQSEKKKEDTSVPLSNIAAERLSKGVTVAPTTVMLEQPPSAGVQIHPESSSPKTENVPPAPIEPVKPAAPTPVRETPPPYKGADPYREPIE